MKENVHKVTDYVKEFIKEGTGVSESTAVLKGEKKGERSSDRLNQGRESTSSMGMRV